MLPIESYLVKVLPESFYLNGHTLGFRSQTKKNRATLQDSVIHSGSDETKEK